MAESVKKLLKRNKPGTKANVSPKLLFKFLLLKFEHCFVVLP